MRQRRSHIERRGGGVVRLNYPAKLGLSLGILAFFATPQFAQRPFRDSERRYWAYQKVVKPPVPAVKNRSWVRNPIDAFILAKLEEKGLRPNPPADKITLLRRAALDVTGLPPSPEDVQDFLADASPRAYEKAVDRLLASPAYGERWARHWLDLARYAESEGFRTDVFRPNVWRYRDYVIESLNQDKPYDRFVKEQIAGDELYPDDAAARVATGFNRHFSDEFNMNDPIQRRQEILNDITDTVGSVFLAMTYGCARCHDHKFDAILQADYYKLQAFFANTRNENSLSLLTGDEERRHKEQVANWDSQTREIRAAMDTLLAEVRADRLKGELVKFLPEVQQALIAKPDDRTPFQRHMYARIRSFSTENPDDLAKRLKDGDKARYAELRAKLATFDHLKPPDPPVTQGMIDEGAEAPRTYVLTRGVHDAPAEEVQPGFLTILDPNPAPIVPPVQGNSTGRRSALANWIASRDNPLTARVMVNRIWHSHFGKGIVGSTSDFGVMGDRPSHRELLDYLASTFVENGWSMKKLHRTILLSNAYRQSSAHNKAAAAIDPSNKLLWRFDRRRLEAEAIRDSMLFASGQLNPKLGGPGFYAPLPPGAVPEKSVKDTAWTEEKDPAESNRRSIYIVVKRNLPYPLYEAFDLPDTAESCARRHTTVTPAQSLALMNNEVVLGWAAAMAGRILNDSGISADAQIDRLYRLAFSRRPKPAERQAVAEFLKSQAGLIRERLARAEPVRLPEKMPSGLEQAHAAAFVDLCHALLNANEFLYIN
jgi:hypothetical protein